ncbi:MAG TPA: site-specific DNA-methyltransferase [Candidatus Pullichristensenella avicola]|nr:site-specific DNA-methyltransferase [Candidatus Pullichristensenella avicola]
MAMGKVYFQTRNGSIYHGDCLDYLSGLDGGSVNLVVTSPPYALIKKKQYGNEKSSDYLDWFRPFAREIYRVLADNGSFVLNIGGSWNKGEPTRSLYHFKVLIMLCEEYGFHLAQEMYYWNPSKLPNPAEWCTIRKIRVKDSIEPVWWLSKTPYPKASNQRVLQPYSKSMNNLLEVGYKAKLRPSGHNISNNFMVKHKGSIPPNLIALPNTESNSQYIKYCTENGLPVHPARFPGTLPEYFIRLCTDEHDLVVDPFGGSCVTGEVAEKLNRRWCCCDTVEEYIKGAVGRFQSTSGIPLESSEVPYYIYKPGYLWDSIPEDTLDPMGGKRRVAQKDSKE